MDRLFKSIRRFTKFAYKYRGLARIAEAIRKYYSKDHSVLLINDFDDDLLFYCTLGEHMGSQIFWRGFYSINQLALLRRLLRPEMVFLDIGANHGEFTVFAAKRLTHGKVIAFEPVSFLFQQLKCHVQMNTFTNVQLVQKGLGERDAQVTIYTKNSYFEDGTKHAGLPTLYPTQQRSDVCETIEITALDSFVKEQDIERIDIIKIDIEGSELSALRGGKETLTRFKPIIFIEVSEENSQAAGYSSSDLLHYLATIGYRFEAILPEGRTKPVIAEQLTHFQNIVCRVQ